MEFYKNRKTPEEKQSILVIDDCLDMLSIGRSVLEMDGFKVFTAQSGAAAIQTLSEIKTPDLILLDMQMDDMSGSDFLKILETKNPDIINDVPIVFYTGEEQVPQSKAVGFIRKTGDINKLLQSIHHFIEVGHSLTFKNMQIS
jgi:adenylate cyclase